MPNDRRMNQQYGADERTSPTTTKLPQAYQGSHSFTDQKIQDFSGTFQSPHEKFSRTFSEPTNV